MCILGVCDAHSACKYTQPPPLCPINRDAQVDASTDANSDAQVDANADAQSEGADADAN